MNIRNNLVADNPDHCNVEENSIMEKEDLNHNNENSDNGGEQISHLSPNTSTPFTGIVTCSLETSYSRHGQQSIPPVYISTLSKSPSYDHMITRNNNNDAINFSSSDEYERQYPLSPPNIDKAPSFLSRMGSRSNDQDLMISNIVPPSPSTTPPEDKHVWTKQEVELLLDLYETYKEQLKDPRVRKTKIWEDIAQIIRDRLESDVNGCQCNQKFRNLKADFQKVVEHNGRPGTFKRVCKYYDRLAIILNYPLQHLTSTYQISHKTHPKVELHENIDLARPQDNRDIYYVNGHTSPPSYKPTSKRKSQDSAHYNGMHSIPTEAYYPSKKLRASCNCECSHEITTLRETMERINNYIVSRASHEEERMRRIEEQHREKLIAIGRFVDIFKDFIHKLT